jgi:hypothetical protein
MYCLPFPYLRKKNQMAAAPPTSSAAAVVPVEFINDPRLGSWAMLSKVGEFDIELEANVATPTRARYPAATQATVFIYSSLAKKTINATTTIPINNKPLPDAKLVGETTVEPAAPIVRTPVGVDTVATGLPVTTEAIVVPHCPTVLAIVETS